MDLSASPQVNPRCDESTPLLRASGSPSWLALRYGSSRKCVSSKAALLVLLWSFLVGLLSGVFLNPDLYITFLISILALFAYVAVVCFSCFFPLAGFCADICCGRYKTVVISLWIVLISVPMLLVAIGLSLAFLFLIEEFVFILPIILSSVTFILLGIGLIGFTANVVQFGMDQLHDSPGEDRTLFIHWYVWTYYAGILIDQLAWNLSILSPYNHNFDQYYNIIGYCLLALTFLLVIVVLPITLCLARCRRRWFLIEPGQYNPYKLVYRVTKFARQHKIPVRRSAFTYCEDEVPRGLDLGKEKYGGPYTTEQVEDVKAFYGILKVLFSFGVVFFLNFAADSILPLFALHASPYHIDMHVIIYDGTLIQSILINNGLLSPLLIVICIPLYLCLLRPFISNYVPGMLKRMGLGMMLVLFSLLATFAMDLALHMKKNELYSYTCMFEFDLPLYHPTQISALLVIQLTLSALSRMLIYIGAFEFICSQSPHSMKGMLIGVLYAIRGFYQLLAALLTLPYFLVTVFRPSCGVYYYLMNIVVGMVALLVYVWVAKRYRYRVRDEPCNVRQYAEEYYSNPQRERNYDYSDDEHDM